ncbi:hypothetical protein Cni_G29120 [Canna indica]|uniref:Peptidase A1 domain-containing protein n=1 Tax=Canna indica TaxID=4628 RepID=A0AAQ3QPC3_9LILI|nr:hypothetical protein Cni_G29120 [Canna indica]
MLSILLVLFSSLSHAFSSTTNGTGFRVRLIHRNSPLSPFHKPNATHNDEWEDMISRSEARLNYFKSIQDYMILSPGDIQIPLALDSNAEYLMKFSIGTPPVPIAAIADTGGATMWIQALPCKSCYPQNSPVFDPSKSSTFTKMACSDPICAYYSGTCTNGNACAYKSKYEDNSYSMGDLAYDDFTFEAPVDDSGVSVAHTVPFGCGHEFKGVSNPAESGNMGLCRSKTSFINQLRPMTNGLFSHCLNENQRFQSVMEFGNYAQLWGKPTPMKGRDFYYVNLIDISVSGERVHIPPGTFHIGQHGHGGLILDSGTPMTYLVSAAYWPLKSLFMNHAKLQLDVPLNGRMCYKGVYADLYRGVLPTMTFHFEGGLYVDVPPLASFIASGDNHVCAIFKESNFGLSIFGSLMQRNLMVGYDLGAQKIYMANTKCIG